MTTRKKRTFISLAALLVIFLCLLLPVKSHAAVSYRVRRGDSLARIAKRFRVNVRALKKANHLSSDRLKPGKRLIIAKQGQSRHKAKRKTSGVSRKKAGKEAGPVTAAKKSAAGRTIYHTIRKGDTLYALSRKYSIPVKELMAMNGIHSGRVRLRPGRKLAITGFEMRKTERASRAASASSALSAQADKKENRRAAVKDQDVKSVIAAEAKSAIPAARKEPQPEVRLNMPPLENAASAEAVSNSQTAGEKVRQTVLAKSSALDNTPVEDRETEEEPDISIQNAEPAGGQAALSNTPAGEGLPTAALLGQAAIERIIKRSLNPVQDTYHLVRRGDTLASVARKYHVSIRQIRRLNDFRAKRVRLIPGESIIVRKGSASHKGFARIERTYKVKRGDTLYGIARRFGKTTRALERLNGLKSARLKPGRHLIVEVRKEPAPGMSDDRGLTRARAQARIATELRALTESPQVKELSTREKLVKLAKSMLNIPYRFGGSTFYGIDCSAYVQKVFSFLGINLPRTAREQFEEGETVSLDKLAIGDLIFFHTYASFPSHVGIYLGQNLFIHASSKEHKVTIDSLDTPFFMKHFIAAKRLISDSNGKESDDKD